MRLPALTELTPRQQEISDKIAARRGATRGPFLIWLRSPELAEKVDALGAYCRFDSSINERLRELSLLIAARHFDAQYSWNAHHKKAIEAGVSAESVRELARNEVPHFAHADERLLYALATQILGDHFVDQDTFDAALAEWGEAGLVDVIGCVGNFSMLAMLLNTFQVDLKPGDEPPFPDVRGFARVAPAQMLRTRRPAPAAAPAVARSRPMRRTAASALALTAAAVAAAAVAVAGCAARSSAGAAGSPNSPGSTPAAGAAPSPSMFASAAVIPAGGPNPQAAIPNPGSGTGNQSLVRALLPQSSSGRLRALLLPPAVVALPDRDRGSLFIPLRQAASGVQGPPECLGWTAGLWLEAVTSFNEPGVQLAIIEQSAPASSGWPVFSEAIITGPPAVLGSLADPALPAGCRTITSQTAYPGGVLALAAPRLGLGSRAFEVTGTGKFPVWTWAEVVQGPGFLLEVRIPVQSALPGSAARAWLGNITAAAYHRAEKTLR